MKNTLLHVVMVSLETKSKSGNSNKDTKARFPELVSDSNKEAGSRGPQRPPLL